jgi:hypothetical protein
MNGQEETFVFLGFNWESGEGNAYIKGSFFLKDQTTQIDMIQDWIVTLEFMRETIQKAALAPKTKEIKK